MKERKEGKERGGKRCKKRERGETIIEKFFDFFLLRTFDRFSPRLSFAADTKMRTKWLKDGAVKLPRYR